MMCENHTPVQGLLHHTLFPYCVDRHSLPECQQEYAICRLVASVLIRYLWVTPFAFSLDLKWRFGGEDPFPSFRQTVWKEAMDMRDRELRLNCV